MWVLKGLLTSCLKNHNHGVTDMHYLDSDYICIPEAAKVQFCTTLMRQWLKALYHDIEPHEYRQGFLVKTENPKTFWYRIKEDGKHEKETVLFRYITLIMNSNEIPVKNMDGEDNYRALIYKMAPETSIDVHKDWARRSVFLVPLLNFKESFLHIHDSEDGPPVSSIPFDEDTPLLFDNSNVWHSGENRSKKERICLCISFYNHSYEYLKERMNKKLELFY